MKFVKRISLFFIYPLSMFAFGFAANMAIMEYFYPGNAGKQQIEVQKTEIQKEEKESVPVSYADEPVITANTRYVVQEYHIDTGDNSEVIERVPDKFIGLSREKLEKEISTYNNNPSLTDQEQGFDYMELVSFSSGRVVVKKSFQSPEEEKGFFLLNEDHYVVVYNHDLSNIYMNTDIRVEELPQALQEEILQIKYVEDEKDLYNFLESYSS